MPWTASTPKDQLVEFVRLRERIDDLSRALLASATPVFGTVSLPTPNVDASPELAFIRTASWLYSHYKEAGRVSVKFLMDRPAVQNLPEIRAHERLVHALRTWSQHTINPAPGNHDRGILKTCSDWFEEACAALLPSSDEDWRQALNVLLRESCAFVSQLTKQVEDIRADDARAQICQQWEDRIARDWPAYRFHEIVSTVANDMGRNTVDPVALFRRSENEIRKVLRITNESDLEFAARQCIERVLLTEVSKLLPITGRDIIDTLGVEPGQKVGELLQEARKIYEEDQCTRDQLLDRLVPLVGSG
ncbi:hypothetical protein ACFYO6_05565 [Streptomyces anthocyanicus]|uniref:hypothetical protein n=1 Tax=Streptomyces anthocyanicus TaxID=68174 RepID=UPI0036744F2A